MILIGLTGTIGSGKTFALNFFKSKKITVFSADDEVKKTFKNKIIKDKIYKKFQKLVDGVTDYYTLHTIEIWDFEDLEKAMDEPDFEEKYSQALARWS